MQSNRDVLKQALEGLSLDYLHLEADGALNAAIPKPQAQRLSSLLEACSVEATWAPDHTDRSMAWVYVSLI